MNLLKTISILFLLFILYSCDTQQTNTSDSQIVIQESSSNKIKRAADLNWEKLNPARGDKSPQAADIWGDRKKDEPTGFLVKFVDGFSSPPHIHNVTYRAVVISGLVHNDDPSAEKMWMPAGSFWTQPAGESHITAAKGKENIAYVEIDKGPYLVEPIENAFDKGERPVNMDKSNLLWLDASSTSYIADGFKVSPEVSFLWGDLTSNKLNGSFVKLPADFDGSIVNKGSVFNAIVIEGQVSYNLVKNQNATDLAPGSLFTSEESSLHQLSTKEESIIYVRTNGPFNVQPNYAK